MVELMFIEVRKRYNEEVDFASLDSISGERISLAASVQYLDLLPVVKEYLERKGKVVLVKKGAYYDGHVVGCQPQAFDMSGEDFLLLCDGIFHALNNALIIDREIYVFNGEVLTKVKKEDLMKYTQKIQRKKNKFLINKNIGLLVSNKIGQKSNSILKIKRMIEKLGKNVYVFETDNVDISEFENFRDIKIFVNTACFGLGIDDDRIINLEDVTEFLYDTVK